MATENRYDRLLDWLDEHNISADDLGEKLGMSGSGARRLCNAETIPVERHRDLVRLGIPEELLPVGRDRRRGRPKRTPIFPGLAADQTSLSAS